MSLKSVLPYFTQGTVIKGFGRGSKALGIPTGINIAFVNFIYFSLNFANELKLTESNIINRI